MHQGAGVSGVGPAPAEGVRRAGESCSPYGQRGQVCWCTGQHQAGQYGASINQSNGENSKMVIKKDARMLGKLTVQCRGVYDKWCVLNVM